MENMSVRDQNDLSLKESNFQESGNNSLITMSISISMEGEAKRNKEERIKSIKFANELKILEKITHDTSDRNINDPNENSDMHFINMINFKNLIQLNFDRKISSFERLSELKEKEIIDLMFTFHYLKEELEGINDRLNIIQLSPIKHTRNYTSHKAEVFLNQSNQSNLNTSSRSYSASCKNRFNSSKILSGKKDVVGSKDKFGVFLPHVCINIASDTNIQQISQTNLKEGKIPPTNSGTSTKSNKQTSSTVSINQTNNLKKTYNTTPIKIENKIKTLDVFSNIASNYSSNKSTKDTSTIAPNAKKLYKNLSGNSNKSSIKNSNTTSCSTINKFLSVNEKKSTNKLINEHIKRITYKLEPKKKSENFKGKVENFVSSQPTADSFYNDSCLGSHHAKSYPIKILDICSKECVNSSLQDDNVNKIEYKLHLPSIDCNSPCFLLFNDTKNKIIFSNIFSFLNIKNKLKNVSKLLRLTFVQCQIKKVEELVKDKNKLIDKAKINRKSNLLELILEMEILAHRESKLRAILNYYKLHSDN